MRRPDPRIAQIGGPDFISQCFQIKTYSGEPFTSKFARNLLSKQLWRSFGTDEPQELGPEVPLIVFTFLLPRLREGLAGTGAGPDGAVIGPPGHAEGEGPPTDSCEQMYLRIAT